MANMQALAAGSRWAHRRVRLSEWVRDRFWFIPLLLVLGGVLAAVVVAHPEVVGLPRDWGLGRQRCAPPPPTPCSG